MKKLLLFLLFAGLTSAALSAQSVPVLGAGSDDQAIRNATEALTQKYSLDADQAKQMYIIQQRKVRNLTEIAGLQQTDPTLFRVKTQNVQQGTLANIRRILHSKEQVLIYQRTQGEVRMLRSQKQQELLAKKATKEEIDSALLTIYAE